MLREVWPNNWGNRVFLKFGKHNSSAFREIVHLDSFGIFEWRFGRVFSNSVPQDRLLDAVQALIVAWKDRHPGDPSISVDLSATGDPIQSTFADTYRKSAYNVRSIKTDDLFVIVKASLSSHYFSALGSIWRQIRGAGIGSQISPTISNLAVTMVERAWQHSFEALLCSQKPLNFAFVRYVDNRFAVFNSVIAKSEPIVIYSTSYYFLWKR